MTVYKQSLQNHMKMLCQTIGARPTGSTENKTAVDYAFDVLTNCGFQARKQEFDCIDWHNFGATLLVNGKNIPVVPAEYAKPCNIKADFVCIDTVETLQNAELTNKIVVLYGDLCNEPLMPKNFEFYNPAEHKQIIALLEEKNPCAIITINPNKEHIIQDGDFNIPCAVVSHDTLDTFLNSTNQKAELDIHTKRIPATAHNVIATYGTSGNKYILSAHIDTKPNTPGALDNASGVSALLALAEALNGKECPFQIEIVLFNGEDYYSTPGKIAYMRELKPEYSMAVNIDGIGLKGSAASVSFYEFSEDMEKRIMACAAKIGDIEKIEPWHMGDHMIFVMQGIPTIAITASNIFDIFETVIHSPADNMQNIDFDTLSNVVDFLLYCVEKSIN